MLVTLLFKRKGNVNFPGNMGITLLVSFFSELTWQQKHRAIIFHTVAAESPGRTLLRAPCIPRWDRRDNDDARSQRRADRKTWTTQTAADSNDFSFLWNSQVCVGFSRASDGFLQTCLRCYLTRRAEAAAAAAAAVAAAAPNSAFNFQQVHRRADAWIPMTMRLLTQFYHELLSL